MIKYINKKKEYLRYKNTDAVESAFGAEKGEYSGEREEKK